MLPERYNLFGKPGICKTGNLPFIVHPNSLLPKLPIQRHDVCPIRRKSQERLVSTSLTRDFVISYVMFQNVSRALCNLFHLELRDLLLGALITGVSSTVHTCIKIFFSSLFNFTYT